MVLAGLGRARQESWRLSVGVLGVDGGVGKRRRILVVKVKAQGRGAGWATVPSLALRECVVVGAGEGRDPGVFGVRHPEL